MESVHHKNTVKLMCGSNYEQNIPGNEVSGGQGSPVIVSWTRTRGVESWKVPLFQIMRHTLIKIFFTSVKKRGCWADTELNNGTRQRAIQYGCSVLQSAAVSQREGTFTTQVIGVWAWLDGSRFRTRSHVQQSGLLLTASSNRERILGKEALTNSPICSY